MKIAHVTPYDLAVRGGVNASVVELVRRQQALGHTVDLIGGASADRDDLPSWKRVRSIVVKVHANGSIAPLAVPRDGGPGSELERLVVSGGYDVLVVHEPALPLGMAMLIVSKSANVGVFHAYSETLGAVARMIGTFSPVHGVGELSPWLRKLDRRIAVSLAAEEFASTYLNGSYVIVPNGIDVPDRAPHVEGTSDVLFLGRPEPRKGLDILLHAFTIVRRAVPSARLRVAGDGAPEQWAPYRARAGELGVAEVTAFLGRVSDEEKRALFARAAVFSSPATGGESQGVVLLEAMALGTPVVASDIAGYRTVISSGHDGLLVPPNDAHALAIAIARLLQDRALATELAAAARIKVERTYDWKVVVPRHIDQYDEAIRASARRSTRDEMKELFV